MSASQTANRLIASRAWRPAVVFLAASLALHVLLLGGLRQGMRLTPVATSRDMVLNAELIAPPLATMQVSSTAAQAPPQRRSSAAASNDAAQGAPAAEPEPFIMRPAGLPQAPIPVTNDPLPPPPPAPEPPPPNATVVPPNGVPGAAVQVTLPARVAMTYVMKWRWITLEGSTLWTLENGRYAVRSEAVQNNTITFQTESSEGSVGATGIEPERYSDKRLRSSERATHFQRDKALVSFSSKTETVPLTVGTQDKLSVRYQIGLLLQGNPQLLQPGRYVDIPVASTGSVDTWRMVVRGRETLRTDLGDIDTWKVSRESISGNPYEVGVEVWIAPDRLWLPVRIRLTSAKDGEADAILSKFEAQ
jgi:hypothetical protein